MFAHAEARHPAWLSLQPGRAAAGRDDQRLSIRAAHHAQLPLPCAAGRRAVRGRKLFRLQHPQAGTVAGGGPGNDHQLLHRSGRGDDRLHERVCRPHRRDRVEDTGGAGAVRGVRQSDRLAGHRLHKADPVGRARAQAAADRHRTRPGAEEAARCSGLRQQPALAWAERQLSSGLDHGPVPGGVFGTQRAGGAHPGGSGKAPRTRQCRNTAEAEQAGAEGQRRSRARRQCRRGGGHHRPHAGNDAGRTPGHPLQAERQAV